MDHYFESSYLTWEITPGKNLEFMSGLFEHLTDLEDNEVNTWSHTETSDYYFQQRPIGGDRPFPVSGLQIQCADLEAILINHGLVPGEKPQFVEDPQMDQYRQAIQQAACFSNASYAVFFSSVNDIVTNIWFNYEEHIAIESDTFAIIQLLQYLGKTYALILVDWYEKRVIALSVKEALVPYLHTLRSH